MAVELDGQGSPFQVGPDSGRLILILLRYDQLVRPANDPYLRQAGINMIWVTLSNGFSNQTEKLHQEDVGRYIGECHRQGIM